MFGRNANGSFAPISAIEVSLVADRKRTLDDEHLQVLVASSGGDLMSVRGP